MGTTKKERLTKYFLDPHSTYDETCIDSINGA